MLNQHSDRSSVANQSRLGFFTFCAALLALPAFSNAATVNVTVVSPTLDGTPIDIGYRWVIEEDVTDPPVVDTTGLTPADCASPAQVPGIFATVQECQIVSLTHATQQHKSYMPVVASGHVDTSGATTTLPVGLDPAKRYYISVLPDQSTDVSSQAAAESTARDCQLGTPAPCYTMSGQRVLFASDAATSTDVTVVVPVQPLPTAQIFVRAFNDSEPINGVWDDTEVALEGWTVFFYDFTGGPVLTDNYGNPIGTVYEGLDPDGLPHIRRLGDGTIHTMTTAEAGDPLKNPYGLVPGEALVKNIAPGKYGVQIVPPYGQGWQQTSTIEGTPGLDVWVKAGEPRYFAEFGPAGHHAEFGFVNVDPHGAFPDSTPYFPLGSQIGAGPGSITGRITNLRMRRPPDYNFDTGSPLPLCWVGLNDLAGTQGYGVWPCDENDSTFNITGVPAGTYQLVVFDRYLQLIWNSQSVDVGINGAPLAADMGDVNTFRWYGTQEHFVFMDENGNGWQDPGEAGIPEQAINIRYKDGSFYGTSTTDLEGYLPFDEIFPFFSWLVAEVDFARFKATGVTIAVDAGGKLPTPGSLADTIGGSRMTPQIQDPAETPASLAASVTGLCGTSMDASIAQDGSLLTSGCLTRTELAGAPPLLEGFNAFIGSTDRFWWGKQPWGPGENGGISGIVHYATTRAEDDPRYAAAEDWEPGVPRVQVNVYPSDATGAIAGALADVDNYPFCWDPNSDGNTDSSTDTCPAGVNMGPEDIERSGSDSVFDLGAAIDYVHTDSFDDSLPENCPGNTADPYYLGPDATTGAEHYGFQGRCFDGLRNWNQVRPGVFDGGFGLGVPWDDVPVPPGYYVVEANTPPGYELVKEQDKNVDFGDTLTLNPLALPPLCVGDPNPVPDKLDLFAGVDSAYAGDTRPLCDRKLVEVTDGKNAAADFFVFTKTPVTGHIQGFVLNDVGNEFDPLSPNFSEKFAPSFIPVSVRDHAGNEVYHTTTDRYGTYNAIVPSTYRINTPMPSGVSGSMLQVCLNSPVMENPDFDTASAPSPSNPLYVPEPNFNPQYSQFCYTLNFQPGQTTYLDTPVLPVAAFVGPGNVQLDCELPVATPTIREVTNSSPPAPLLGGPYFAPGGSRGITITSMGSAVDVPNPNSTRVDGNNQDLIPRDLSFGTSPTDPNTDPVAGVWIGDARLTVTSWTPDTITATIPSTASTGELTVVRTNGLKTVNSVTVIIDNNVADPMVVDQFDPTVVGDTIQNHIDTLPAGGVLLIPPGTYEEALIVTRPIQLQGWGAPVTVIDAAQTPTDKIARWQVKANYLANCTGEIGLLENQANNNPDPAAECGFVAGSGLFLNEEGPGVLVAPRDGVFNGLPARIDGFTFTGADQSGGIVINGYADYMEVSNNRIINNQGPYAAGIRVGEPSLLAADDSWVDASNDYVNIHNNHILENGALFEVTGAGGGIGIFTGSHEYQVRSNYICGNNTLSDGAGIAHYGLSNNGVIADNKILFNQAFDQTADGGGNAGGILISGHEPVGGVGTGLGTGSGNVKVLRNVIQGNNAGSGSGGGIAVRSPNGEDALTPTPFKVDILNNFINNNVAASNAGAILLEDAIATSIVNNTIMNNDSTATSADSFCATPPSPTASCPQPAGIVSRAHSPTLAPSVGTTFSDPFMLNNIVVGNRSQYWYVNADNTDTTCAVPAGMNSSGIGCLLVATDAYRDLDVTGTSGALTSMYGVLTTGTTVSGASTNNTFVAGDLTTEATLVDTPYRNGPPGFTTVQPDGTVVPGGEFPITAAAAADEGGNFIDVHYGPLSPGNSYHLVSGSDAIDCGMTPSAATYPNRYPDVDGDLRAYGSASCGSYAGGPYDIGGDEVTDGGTPTDGGNAAPMIVAPADLSTVSATPGDFVYHVRAIDPNGDPLGYALTADSGLSSCAIAIDPNTGLITGTVDATLCVSGSATDAFHVSVTDDGGTTWVSSAFTFDLSTAPVANANGIQDTYVFATDATSYTVLAGGVPDGVLANDYNPLASAMTASLVTNVDPAAGSVSLGTDGGFTFTRAGGLTSTGGFIGTTTFTYQAVNAGGVSAPVTVTLTVSLALPDIPIDTATAPESTSFLQCPLDTNKNGTMDAGEDVNLNGVLDAGEDTNGNGILDAGEGQFNEDGNFVAAVGDTAHEHVVCRHLAAGDGFAVMADGLELYTFGFNDVSRQPANLAIEKGALNAHFPAPTLAFDEGDQVYLGLTNAGTLARPDLFDPHTVHFHGFPNASTVFDGVPESSIAINQGFTFTYYYDNVEPGTYMYHCHVEAAEHMQMGMLGNLYVRPAQDGMSFDDPTDTEVKSYSKFVYNDGDGTTGYDVEKAIQIGSFDSNFHILHLGVQPLPFAEMHDDYPMLNGRGYPDTVSATPVPVASGGDKESSGVMSATESSQNVDTRIEVNAGDRVLLRISNLNVTQFYTLALTGGLTMHVVGTGARILRGPDGQDLYYDTNSITLGGGEAVDVLVDTTGVPAGTYLLYSPNLNELSNGTEDFGGMMTEFVIH